MIGGINQSLSRDMVPPWGSQIRVFITRVRVFFTWNVQSHPWDALRPDFFRIFSDLVSGYTFLPFLSRFGLNFGDILVTCSIKKRIKTHPGEKNMYFHGIVWFPSVFSLFSGSLGLKMSMFSVPRATFFTSEYEFYFYFVF